jgi:pimeloyl-ACP methyl ester carboxylesterase
MPFLTAGGHRLHYEWMGPGPEERPTLVLLHHGLGCVETWQDFPQRLIDATGCGALLYSRKGHGRSDPVPTSARPADYLEHEGWVVLPEVLAATGVRRPILVGHSDGGTIALYYAARPEPAPLPPLALVTIAAHVYFDAHSRSGMVTGRAAWLETDLKTKLARYHCENTEGMYLSWSERWLDPAALGWSMEELLPRITCPTLAIQGSEDEYGDPGQVTSIVTRVSGPSQPCMLPDIGHEPHREAPERVTAIIADFVAPVLSKAGAASA